MSAIGCRPDAIADAVPVPGHDRKARNNERVASVSGWIWLEQCAGCAFERPNLGALRVKVAA
jgi:hypothetical protein